MLNLTEGIPIAVIKPSGRYIYLNKDYVGGNVRETNPNVCEYCGRTFNRSYEKNQHLENSCRKKEVEEMKQFVIRALSNDLPADQLLELISNNNNDYEIDFSERDDILVEPLPRDDIREIKYIAGPQGSGKSYYTSRYLEKFNEKFPEHAMFLFSRIGDDISYRQGGSTNYEEKNIYFNCNKLFINTNKSEYRRNINSITDKYNRDGKKSKQNKWLL